MTQKRRTGGIRILTQKANIHLDPGPGALIYSLEAKLNPQKLNGILVSHCHPDHYNDAAILIEAMAQGGVTRKRGILAAAHGVLHGSEHCEASISQYHQQMPEQIIDATPGTTFEAYDLQISVAQAKHTDPNAVGFRITSHAGDFAYTSDSEYFTGISKPYQNARILILCVLRPSDSPWKGHMTTADAAKIIEETRPEMAVLTHFGMQMIAKDPSREAQQIQQRTGTPTVAAIDGMHITMGQQIQVQTTRKQKSLGEFLWR